jgi:hypothetical protein
MSASTEIPDIVTSITNAIAMSRLRQSDQQGESEKLKSNQEISTNGEARRTNQIIQDLGDVAPSACNKEIANERVHAHAGTDHDVEARREPNQGTPNPSAIKAEGYQGPTPSSLKDNQANMKYDTKSAKDEGAEPSKEEAEVNGGTSKSSFIGSLIPFLKTSPSFSSFPPPSTPQSAPLHGENPFERPRLHSYSSSSQKRFDRPKPKPRRLYTMPVQTRSETPETPRNKAARSKWISAAHNLRFPLRRRKQELDTSKNKGTEVITMLMAGAPAANLIASHMISDERSHRRIPVIVDLLKVFSQYSQLI